MARTPTYDREAVLHKALDLFWTKGYHVTSLKDLEKALDMRPGSIYSAFGSKEKLCVEALELYAERGQEKFENTVSEADSLIAGLANHVRGFGSIGDREVPARACMLVKTVLETPDDDPVLRKKAEELMRGVEDSFAGVFRHAKTAGELPLDADPNRLARWLQTQIFGLRVYAQRNVSGSKIRMLAEDIAHSIECLCRT